ncbi:unnamed protein product [Ectocarpus sp. 12 AP-2014]
MWFMDCLYYVLCAKRLKNVSDGAKHLYAIRQKRQRLDGSGTYMVYVIDD